MSLIELGTTADGSPTLINTEFGSTYHSDHGAIQESMHVFIAAGLERLMDAGAANIRIFEMGFGSGLNALLTLTRIDGADISVNYTAVERIPIKEELVKSFTDQLPEELSHVDFTAIHESPWGELNRITCNFQLCKIESDLTEMKDVGPFDLIYYDAFEPRTQPELWTLEIFRKLASWMVGGGVFVTYCAKGQVRRDLESVGFSVERISGPPGKREMIRATLR